MTDDGKFWALGFWRDAKDPKAKLALEDQRSLRDGELERYERAVNLLDKTAASRLILPLAENLSELTAQIGLALDRGSQFDRDDRKELRSKLDAFLTELVACRSRLEKALESCLDAHAVKALRDAYKTGYEKNRHYRLAWQMRNSSIHGDDALDCVRHESTLVNEVSEKTMIVDVVKLVERHKKDSKWQAVAALWGDLRTESLVNVAALAFGWAEYMFSQAIAVNSAEIEDAANVVMGLYAEAASPKTQPVIFTVGPEEMADQGPVRNIGLKVIDPVPAIEARLTIETARARLADAQVRHTAPRD